MVCGITYCSGACGGSLPALADAGPPDSIGDDGPTGSIDHAGSVDLSDFVGAPWTGAFVIATTCAGTTRTSTSSGQYPLAANGSVFGWTGADGCVFEFTLVGDTATLSNAPTSCILSGSDGATVLHTFTSYTLTTSDGHHMTAAGQGSNTSQGEVCPFTFTGSLTR